MHNSKKILGVTLTLGLAACGLFAPPANKTTTPTTFDKDAPPPMLFSNGTDWNKQGTIPACTDIGNSGAYPYSTGGPSWRQWAFIDDGTTPNNYSTITLALPDPTKNALEPYTTLAGATTYPGPFIYQEFNQDKLFLTGTLEGTTTSINKVYVYPGGSYGVTFRKNGDFYDIPILQKSVTSYKDFDQNGNIIKDANGQPVVYSGNMWSYPNINGKSVRLLGNQTVKLEFYFSSSVYYKKHSVLTNYLDPATNQIKSGWVVVDMPYQDAWVKITTDKYMLAGSSTVLSTNGQPLLAKVPFRGQINAPSPDRQSLLRSELWYSQPQGVTSMSGSSFHTWLDQRKDAMFDWGFSNQRIGKATVGSNGELSNVTALQGPTDWNLGLPSSSNAKNCISKTVYVKPDGQSFDIIGAASPQTPVLQEPEIDLDLPFTEEGGSITPTVSGPEGSTYSWNFGDGTTATGEYVTHTYPEAGTYTLQVTATTPNGVVKTKSTKVAVLPRVNEISPNLSLQGSDTATFDLGDPVPGFEYQWDFGDGTTGTGSRTTHDYPTLGTYVIKYAIIDNRDTLTTQSVGKQNTGKVVVQRETWLTRWEIKPEAKFTTTTPVGVAPLTVNFDASASTAGSAYTHPLTFHWDFGDGTTGTGATATRTYPEGEYVATLTVTDKKGQKDQYRAYVAVRGANSFTKLNFMYPAASALTAANAPGDSSSGPAMQAAGINPQAVTTSSTEYFPYVIHRVSGIRATSFTRWNAYTNSTYRPVYCSEIISTTNGRTIYGQFLNNNAGAEFCNAVFFTTYPAPFSDTINEVVTATSNNLQAVRYDAFSGLRVPKVFIQIVPDRYVPGEYASPYLKENTFTNPTTGKQELMMRVLVRQSEVKNGSVKFKVPVYAVDHNGKQLPAATGYFGAYFLGVNSDCGDCMMVKGKSYITVNVPILQYTMTGQALDLSQIRTYASKSGNASACGTDNSPWLAGYGGHGTLNGCSTVTTSNELPGTPDASLTAYPYPVNAKMLTGANKIGLGATPAEQAAIEKNFGDTVWSVGKIFWSMIPILGDGTDLLGEFYNTYFTTDGGDIVIATLASGGLILDITTGGVSDFTAGMKAAYQMSKAGPAKIVSKVINDEVVNLLAGLKSMPEAVKILKARFVVMGKFITNTNCGLLGYNCFKIYEQTALKFKTSRSLDDINSLKQVDDELNSSTYSEAQIDDKDRVDDLYQSVQCVLKNSFDPLTPVWTINGLRNIVDIKVGDKVYAFSEHNNSFGYYAVNSVYINDDPVIVELGIRSSKGFDKIITTPEHPFFLKGKWVEAQFIKEGDVLQSANGEMGNIEYVNTSAIAKRMYNLSVTEAHTFFIGTQGWLVHNANKCPTNVKKDASNRIIEVTATLDPQYIGGGTAPTKAARNWVKKYGAGNDDAGHILAYALGGGGGLKSDNILPILSFLNRGDMASLEKTLKREVVAGKKVDIAVNFRYDDPAYPKRPTKVYYVATITDPATNETKIIQHLWDNPTQ